VVLSHGYLVLNNRTGIFKAHVVTYGARFETRNQHIRKFLLMDHVSVTNACLREVSGENYLEIGVRFGDSIKNITAKSKWGVDPFIKLSANPIANFLLKKFSFLWGIRFFQVESDVFFEQNAYLLRERPIHVALIDGLHTYAQSLRDAENCLKFLAPNGIIVLDDCNPLTRDKAFPANSWAEADALHPNGWDGAWSGDVWKAIVHLRSTRNDISVCVLDCGDGVGLIKKTTPQSKLQLTPDEIKNMSFEDLDKNREKLLNLKDPSYLNTFIRSS